VAQFAAFEYYSVDLSDLRQCSIGSFAAVQRIVTGSANILVNWFVNSASGGSAVTGTINSAGMYTSPASLPGPNTATVKAVSAADSNISASITVTLLNPIPVLSNIAPQTTPIGAFALTINGANFVQGAQVLFAGSPLNTTFLSSAQLTATGTASSAGMFAITVMNPNREAPAPTPRICRWGKLAGRRGHAAV